MQSSSQRNLSFAACQKTRMPCCVLSVFDLASTFDMAAETLRSTRLYIVIIELSWFFNDFEGCRTSNPCLSIQLPPERSSQSTRNAGDKWASNSFSLCGPSGAHALSCGIQYFIVTLNGFEWRDAETILCKFARNFGRNFLGIQCAECLPKNPTQ